MKYLLDTNIISEFISINPNENVVRLMDSIIGATCQELDITLITRNEKDFKNLEIQIINPF